MSLAVLLILAVLLVAWPFLTVLGHERQRQLLGRPPRPQAPPAAGSEPAQPKPPEAPVAR